MYTPPAACLQNFIYFHLYVHLLKFYFHLYVHPCCLLAKFIFIYMYTLLLKFIYFHLYVHTPCCLLAKILFSSICTHLSAKGRGRQGYSGLQWVTHLVFSVEQVGYSPGKVT